jgi:peptidoglycan/xylan/chitin deacetylase (PgdA/CDA1 family)
MRDFRAALDKWLPSRLLRGSALFQLAGWPMALWENPAPPFLTEALILNHVVITAAGLWPQSPWLGLNLSRLPETQANRGEIALTFDDGPDPEVTPRVLDLLDQRGATASFFCIGERARRHSGLVREICARGHRVENHSHRHAWNFALRGPAGIREELRRAQDVLAELTDRTPVFFRAPFGIRNPWVQPLVQEFNLSLVSWSRRGYDSVLGNPAVVGLLLLRGLRAGDILLMHDGSPARERQGKPVVLEVLPKVLDEVDRRRLSARFLGDTASAEPIGADSD